MRKLFGTDGVRGTANIHPMTADMALRIGAVEAAEGENAGIAIDNLDSAWKP